MKSIGRNPLVMFEALPCENNPEASPGRDFYVRGSVIWCWSPTTDLTNSYYTLELCRRQLDSCDGENVLFTENEARALAALLNGLKIGPTREDVLLSNATSKPASPTKGSKK